MKFAFISFFALFAFVQETPWAPFNDSTSRRHPERVSTIDVGHYKISVRLDDRIPPPLVEGRVEIDLSLTAPAGSIDLDAADMTITEIVSADGTKLTFTHDDKKLTIDLGRKAASGEKFHLAISYTARPKVGMFFITPEPDRPKRPWQVWTQGETEYNHHWFPCYDYPNDRATSEVLISVREKYRTVSNGMMVKSEVVHGWRTEHWKMDIPHVAYLTSIAAGEFDVIEEQGAVRGAAVPIRYFVPKGWHTPEEIRHTFGRTPEIMRFISERTGFPYPYLKYDQVVVEDFTWGGMENVTATTLHPGTVVAKRSWGDRDSDGLIAHELAHQWFGNIVTCRSWAHAWLNEGFATYMASLWQEKEGGRDAMIADLDEGQESYFRKSDEHVRPTVCEYYRTADDVFDDHIYPKGAWILHMLQRRVGNDAWWKGVNKYLTKYKGGVVSTDDFRKCIEEASGADLKSFFDQWVTGIGHPEFKVTPSWDDASKKLTLKVTQIQPIGPVKFQDLATERPVFQVPVDIEFHLPSGPKTQTIEIKEREQSFTFDFPQEPKIILFDRDTAVLKKLFFERSVPQLIAQLQSPAPAWHRGWAARQLSGSEEGVGALGAALAADPSDRVRVLAAGALKETRTPEAGAQLVLALKKNSNPRVRKSIVEALANHAKEQAAELEKIFKEDSSPMCRAAAAMSLGRRGSTSAVFADALKFKDDEVILPGILSGMLASDDPAFLKTCLDAADRTRHSQIRVRAAECLGDYLKEKQDPAALRRFLLLFEDSHFRVRRAAIGKAGDVKLPVVADALEKRIPQESEGRLVRAMQEAIARIRAGK